MRLNPAQIGVKSVVKIVPAYNGLTVMDSDNPRNGQFILHFNNAEGCWELRYKRKPSSIYYATRDMPSWLITVKGFEVALCAE